MCAVPVVSGNLLGIMIAMGLLKLANIMAGNLAEGRHEAEWDIILWYLYVHLLLLFLLSGSRLVSCKKTEPADTVGSHQKYR